MRFSYTLLCLLVLVAACSAKPSDTEVEEALREALTSGLNSGVIEVTSVSRKNGYEGDNGRYVVEAEYTVVFKKSYKEIAEKTQKDVADKSLALQGAIQMQLRLLHSEHGDFAAGHKYTMTAKLPFVKAEKGWRLIRG